jgi:hypothetical protein
MHFRHLIISGFIAGAALILPDIAFAEKGPTTGKADPPKTAVQDNLPVQTENGNAPDKASAESAVKGQPVGKPGLVKDKPVVAKPHAKPIPAANGKVQSSLKKNGNSSKGTLPKAANVQKQSQVKKPPMQSHVAKQKAAVKSIHINEEYAKETTRVSPGLKDKLELSQEPAQKPVSKKKPAPRVIVQKPPVKNPEQDSSHDERYPKRDLPNPPSRTKASGGPSSERTSYGNASISFSDKWFFLDPYFNLIASQIYTSRVAVYRSQWVNAPPSPPPLEAPIFIPYTDAISHG